jgi:hypothetical protein
MTILKFRSLLPDSEINFIKVKNIYEYENQAISSRKYFLFPAFRRLMA